MYNNILDVKGLKVGQAQNEDALTGCTVVICEKGATCGVDVRGSAPGTRETDLLDPINSVQKVHAVVLSGGSAFGLESTCGVSKYLEEKNIGIISIAIYLILCPSVMTETGSLLSFDYLGSKGVIMGIILAIVVVRIYQYILSKNVKIKLPEGTPEYVSNSFGAIIPFIILAIIALIIRMVFIYTPYNTIFESFYALLQIPLNAIVGENIFSQLVLNVVAQSLWVFGIHGSSIIDTLRGPIMFGLDGAQQAAYAANLPLPNIMGMAFSYMYYTAIMYPAVAIAVCCFAKSKRMKMVGKMALPASFFGISEPLVFGLPIVFNPILAIPFIFIPSIVMGIAYLITSLGLVATPIGVQVFNIPLAINGILNGSWTIAILQILLLILSVIMWMPFIKFADKKALEEEKIGELKSHE